MNWFQQSKALKLKPVNPTSYMCSVRFRKKGRDLTQYYDKSPCIHRKIQKSTRQQKRPPKTPITQRLRTDFGRSVGVTIATQLVWLNWLTGSQPSHSPHQLCNRENEHAGIILQVAER